MRWPQVTALPDGHQANRPYHPRIHCRTFTGTRHERLRSPGHSRAAGRRRSSPSVFLSAPSMRFALSRLPRHAALRNACALLTAGAALGWLLDRLGMPNPAARAADSAGAHTSQLFLVLISTAVLSALWLATACHRARGSHLHGADTRTEPRTGRAALSTAGQRVVYRRLNCAPEGLRSSRPQQATPTHPPHPTIPQPPQDLRRNRKP